jgi:hypothetical protein
MDFKFIFSSLLAGKPALYRTDDKCKLRIAPYTCVPQLFLRVVTAAIRLTVNIGFDRGMPRSRHFLW